MDRLIESKGLLEGEAGGVIARARDLNTEAMAEAARLKGWTQGAMPERETSTTQRCSLCGSDVPMLVSGGGHRRICDSCAADEGE
jgi:hypothetical protein